MSGAGEWNLTIASLPVDADSALDNRPICENLELPPTNPRFGNYTYMGGLFVGQVRQYYDDTVQTTPDLSGTGRTLLRFYNPNGLPTQVHSASLILHYTATPYFVYQYRTSNADAFGALILRSDTDNAVNCWEEQSVSWDWLIDFGLDNTRVSRFDLVVPGGDAGWCLSQEPYDDEMRYRPLICSSWENKLLLMRIGNQSNPADMPNYVVPVTMTAWNLSLLPFSWEGRPGAYLNVLVALANEQENTSSQYKLYFRRDGPVKWYYFLSKEHPWARQDARYLPRLWLVW